MILRWIYNSWILMCIFLFDGIESIPITDRHCNWHGSGAASADSVWAVTLDDCATGNVIWTKPQGGVMIVIKRLPAHSQLCLNRVDRKNNQVQIHVKKPDSLEPVFTDKNSTKCLPFLRDAIQLFMEDSMDMSTTSLNSINHETSRSVGFIYEQLQHKSGIDGATASCPPTHCTSEQVINAYCNADIVFIGRKTMDLSKEIEILKMIRRPIDEPAMVVYNEAGDPVKALLHSPPTCQTLPHPPRSTSYSSSNLYIASSQYTTAILQCVVSMERFNEIRTTATSTPCHLTT